MFIIKTKRGSYEKLEARDSNRRESLKFLSLLPTSRPFQAIEKASYTNNFSHKQLQIVNSGMLSAFKSYKINKVSQFYALVAQCESFPNVFFCKIDKIAFKNIVPRFVFR